MTTIFYNPKPERSSGFFMPVIFQNLHLRISRFSDGTSAGIDVNYTSKKNYVRSCQPALVEGAFDKRKLTDRLLAFL